MKRIASLNIAALVLFFVAGFLVLPGLAAAGQRGHAASAAKSTPADQSFVKKAAYGGIAEVEMGKLAKEKASSAEVKQFAEKMVSDHTKANDDLKEIAKAKDIRVPAELDPEHKAKLDKLRKSSGATFDENYMKEQVAGHQKMHDLLAQQAKSGKDQDLKSFAERTLPTVESHHQMAETIQKKLGGQKMSATD
jgi:putative membrane protein